MCVCSGVPEGSYDPEWSVCDLERLDWSSASGWDGLSGIWWWEGTGTDVKLPFVPYVHQKSLTAACFPVFFVILQHEDALAQAAFEEARRRTRDFEDRDRSHREDLEVRATVSEDVCMSVWSFNQLVHA